MTAPTAAADLTSSFRIPEAAMSKHGSFKYKFESEVMPAYALAFAVICHNDNGVQT